MLCTGNSNYFGYGQETGSGKAQIYAALPLNSLLCPLHHSSILELCGRLDIYLYAGTMRCPTSAAMSCFQ